MKYLLAFFLFIPFMQLQAKNNSCAAPSTISDLLVSNDISSLNKYPDIKRNIKSIKSLCVHLVSFSEGRQQWNMLLVTHPKTPHGAFWFLPHDNENSAFDSAVYAVRKYGGGFLSVISGGKRYHQGQDPNRNFANSAHKLSSCRYQKAASPVYTDTVFRIIDAYRDSNMPYLALHNNTNKGGISILRSSRSVRSFLAYPREDILRGSGLKDEDSLVYMAGKSSLPSETKLNKLLQNGLNVKYEVVNSRNNDCSMSNYVVLGRMSTNYYNIEAQHGDASTQKKMIDILMKHVMR